MELISDLETRAAIELLDFRGQNEFFVREEFLVPIFRCAGYSAVGITAMLRDVNLSHRRELSHNRRRYVFPDFVLTNNDIGLWIVDAKSPRVKVDSIDNLQQATEYARKLNCPNIMISNALETYVFTVKTGQLFQTHVFSKDEVCGNRWKELISLLSPRDTMARLISFKEALKLYQTDEYINRSFIMKVLQIYSASDVVPLLMDGNNWLHKSTSFRDRALIAILGAPHGKEGASVLANIINSSLNDEECVVRENLFTCLVSNRSVIDSNHIPKELYSIKPSTALEEMVFVSFLGTTPRGRSVLRRYIPVHLLLRDYIRCVAISPGVSFPIALPLRKPEGLSYQAYKQYLALLPPLLRCIDRDSKTHPETRKVMNSCLSFCSAQNPSVYEFLIRHATISERRTIEHYGARMDEYRHKERGKSCSGIGLLLSVKGSDSEIESKAIQPTPNRNAEKGNHES